MKNKKIFLGLFLVLLMVGMISAFETETTIPEKDTGFFAWIKSLFSPRPFQIIDGKDCTYINRKSYTAGDSDGDGKISIKCSSTRETCLIYLFNSKGSKLSEATVNKGSTAYLSCGGWCDQPMEFSYYFCGSGCTNPSGSDGQYYCDNNKLYGCNADSGWEFISNTACIYCKTTKQAGSYDDVCGKEVYPPKPICSSPNALDGDYYCKNSVVYECDKNANTNLYPTKWKVDTYCPDKCKSGSENPNRNSDLCEDIKETKDECVDSDGGLNYNVRGKTNSNTDYCLDAYNLAEYYCFTSASGDVGIHSDKYRCSAGCKDGKCNTATDCSTACQKANEIACGTEINPVIGCEDVECENGNFCPGNTVCDGKKCIEGMKCNPGEIKECVDTNTYKICKNDGTGFKEEKCGSLEVCREGICTKTVTCVADGDCVDENSCTDDKCIGGICMNTVKECINSEYCDSTTGNCVIRTSSQCMNYQILEDGECKFSVSKLFTSSGFKEYYENNTTSTIIYSISVVLIIILIFYLILRKKGQQVMF